jgi:hypothetical protein
MGSRKAAANDAGLSTHLLKQAIRVTQLLLINLRMTYDLN